MELVVSLLAILLCLIVLKQIYRGKTIPLVCVVYTAYYLTQVVLGSILYITDPSFNFDNLYGTTIRQSLLPMSIGVIFGISALYLGVKSSRIAKKSTPSLNTILDLVDEKYSIETIIIILLVFFSCSIFRTFNLGYLVNLVANTFNFTTLIVGYFWFRLNREIKYLWILALVISFVFHVIQGSRGYAVYPIVFLLVGLILSVSDNKKEMRKRIIVYTSVMILFMPLFSKIQDYRIALGRGVDVSVESFENMVDYLVSDGPSADEKTGLSKNVSRFVIGANFATTSLSPGVIPHFGFKGMDDEIKSMFTLVGSDNVDSYREKRSELNYGTGIAARYGFNITELNSVEFPLFADAYARFGYIGIFVYFYLFSFLFCKLELYVRRLCLSNSVLGVLLLTLLVYNGSLSYGSSYSTLGKVLIFRGLFITFVAAIIAKISEKKILNYRTNHGC